MEQDEKYFTAFQCPACQAEIEATLDMIGDETECPACGAKLKVPDSREGQKNRPTTAEEAKKMAQAFKNRTIRIELGDL